MKKTKAKIQKQSSFPESLLDDKENNMVNVWKKILKDSY